MLLRENGRVEIYADFILVDTIEPEDMMTVDIGVGQTNFFLKVLSKGQVIDEDTDPSTLKFEYHRVKKHWKNRIGRGTLTADNKMTYIE